MDRLTFNATSENMDRKTRDSVFEKFIAGAHFEIETMSTGRPTVVLGFVLAPVTTETPVGLISRIRNWLSSSLGRLF